MASALHCYHSNMYTCNDSVWWVQAPLNPKFNAEAIQWGNQNSLLEKLVQRIKCFGHKWRQWFFYNFIQQILTLRKEQFNNLTKKCSCDPIIKISCNLIFGFVTKVTWQVPHVEQELLTLSEHLSQPWFLVGFMLLDLKFSV